MDKYFAISIVLDSFAKINPHKICSFRQFGPKFPGKRKKIKSTRKF